MPNKRTYADSLVVTESGRVKLAVHEDDITRLEIFLNAWQIQPSVEPAADQMLNVTFPANIEAWQVEEIVTRFDELNAN